MTSTFEVTMAITFKLDLTKKVKTQKIRKLLKDLQKLTDIKDLEPVEGTNVYKVSDKK